MPKLKKNSTTPVSGYMYMTETEFYNLENAARKDDSLKGFMDVFAFHRTTQSNVTNQKYVEAAKKLYYTEDEMFLVDDDANVSITKDGAYVQGWMWVGKNQLNKKRG